MSTRLKIAVLFFALVTACAPEGKKTKLHTYFDLETFANEQIARLDSLHPSVEKTVVSGDQKETKRLTAINWPKELDLFVQADLNKPAYQNSYQVEKLSDQTTVYRAKAGEDVPVKYLRVDADPANGQVKQLEAHMTSHNYLYHSEKKLLLHCQAGPQGEWLLHDYRVTGFQKLVFFDEKPFDVRGEVL